VHSDGLKGAAAASSGLTPGGNDALTIPLWRLELRF
jgi:hypothetical protein